MQEKHMKDVYEVEVKKQEGEIEDKWGNTNYRFFPASSLEEALAKARKIYGEDVQSVEKSNYIFHLD